MYMSHTVHLGRIMGRVLEEVTVRIALKRDLAKKFNSIKEYYGLIHDTEVIRVLVSETYHSIERQT